MTKQPGRPALRAEFALDPDLAFVNHASFGATPRVVLDERQRRLLACERNPLPALTVGYRPGLDEARQILSKRIGATPDSVVWVPNTTYALNLVARSLVAALAPGDEVLLSDQEYGAMRTLWHWLCEQRGVRCVERHLVVPLPDNRGERAAALVGGVSERTKLIFCSHITSGTAAIMPVQEICAFARAHGIMTIIDGAHAPGHIDLDIADIGPDFYAADLHKWLGAPRPSGFLYASPAAQKLLDPLVVSWGGVDRHAPLGLRQEFMGTTDATPWLSVPRAIEFHDDYLAPEKERALELLWGIGSHMEARGFFPVTAATERGLLMRTWLMDGARDPQTLGIRLRDRHKVEVQVEQTPELGPTMRVSVAWYTVERELDRLFTAVDRELRK